MAREKGSVNRARQDFWSQVRTNNKPPGQCVVIDAPVIHALFTLTLVRGRSIVT
jgi:hypothetical protein